MKKHMTSRIFSTFLLALLNIAVAFSQKMTVESFEHAPSDLSASTSLRTDLNGAPCALIKVQFPVMGATFDGYVIGNTDYRNGEYWVYMTKGSKRLKVMHNNFIPLEVEFSDYDIDALEGKYTYVLTLQAPTEKRNLDDGMSYLAMTVKPANAVVRIDGELKPIEKDGTLMLRLQRGSHSYSVEAPGYSAVSSTFTLAEQTLPLQVTLSSTMANITFQCATEGAEIWVNGARKGRTTWNGVLMPGSYKVEVMKEGYQTWANSFVFAQNEVKTIPVPALIAKTGTLDVQYRPFGAEVYLDGKLLGTTPSVFRDVIVGTHQVEIRKEGYISQPETVLIQEGENASLNGSLTEGFSANTNVQDGNKTFTVNGVSFTMIYVQGGTFTMGGTAEQGNDAFTEEKPTHSVTLSDYYLCETEVTQALWQAVMGTTLAQQQTQAGVSRPLRGEGDDYPMYYVTWEDCQRFIERLNTLTGQSFKLPTEAQWEFAARGGNKTVQKKFSGSNAIDEVAWFRGNSEATTHPVKSKTANELGLYDLCGNVGEWCADWQSNYSEAAQTNPAGPEQGLYRIFRGGSWNSRLWRCRTSSRSNEKPSYCDDEIGFRIAF